MCFGWHNDASSTQWQQRVLARTWCRNRSSVSLFSSFGWFFVIFSFFQLGASKQEIGLDIRRRFCVSARSVRFGGLSFLGRQPLAVILFLFDAAICVRSTTVASSWKRIICLHHCHVTSQLSTVPWRSSKSRLRWSSQWYLTVEWEITLHYYYSPSNSMTCSGVLVDQNYILKVSTGTVLWRLRKTLLDRWLVVQISKTVRQVKSESSSRSDTTKTPTLYFYLYVLPHVLK